MIGSSGRASITPPLVRFKGRSLPNAVYVEPLVHSAQKMTVQTPAFDHPTMIDIEVSPDSGAHWISSSFIFHDDLEVSSVHPKLLPAGHSGKLAIRGINFIPSSDIMVRFTAGVDQVVTLPGKYMSPTEIMCQSPVAEDMVRVGGSSGVDTSSSSSSSSGGGGGVGGGGSGMGASGSGISSGGGDEAGESYLVAKARQKTLNCRVAVSLDGRSYTECRAAGSHFMSYAVTGVSPTGGSCLGGSQCLVQCTNLQIEPSVLQARNARLRP